MFDSPSHGDAGVLNRELLDKQTKGASKSLILVPYLQSYITISSCLLGTHSWVASIVQFLQSEYVKGHRIVICGHSFGATISLVCSHHYFLGII